MKLMNRATKSLLRNFGKAIILLLVTFVLGSAISGAISVRQAVQNTDRNLRLDLPGIASMQSNMPAMEAYYFAAGEWPMLEPLTMETLSDIAALPYVRSYSISTHAMLSGSHIERVTIGEGAFGEAFSEAAPVNLKGVHTAGLLDAEEGVVEIVSGRKFFEDEAVNLNYVALVSQEFARLNNLGVGSTLTLENTVWKDGAFETNDFSEDNIFAQRSYDFEVIGIFATIVDINTGDEWSDEALMEDIENRVYVPNQVIFAATLFQMEQAAKMNPSEIQATESPEDMLFLESIYTLYDPDDLPAFKAAAQEMIPEFWMVADAGDAFGDVAASMDTLDSLAAVILWIAIGSSVLIISLIIMLFLRDRKKEMGIYLALGERRWKVLTQLVVEVLAVALIAIAMALVMGNLLSSGISETMLRNDMMAQRSIDGSMAFGVLDQMGVISDMSVDEMLEGYNVSLDVSTVASFFIAAVTTVLVSTIAPMLYILRLNPRKIMM